MKGTKEWYDLIAQFEKDLRRSDYPGYFVSDFTKDTSGSRCTYSNGLIEQLFYAYMSGYTLGKQTFQN
jgi:hypothetical protein